MAKFNLFLRSNHTFFLLFLVANCFCFPLTMKNEYKNARIYKKTLSKKLQTSNHCDLAHGESRDGNICGHHDYIQEALRNHNDPTSVPDDHVLIEDPDEIYSEISEIIRNNNCVELSEGYQKGSRGRRNALVGIEEKKKIIICQIHI